MVPPITTTAIETVCDQKLELGNKVFRAPTPSERISTRNQQSRLKRDCRLQEGSIGITHHLFLEPTLKRQKKKKQQLAKLNKTKNVTTSPGQNKRTNWNGILISNTKRELKSPFACSLYSHKIRSKRRLERGRVTKTKEKIKAINSITLRRLARSGGVQCIFGSANYDGAQDAHTEKSSLPPPFEAKNDDPYIIPKPGQLIFYLWHDRPSPVFDRKQIYRTGVLCSSDGLIRFFNNDGNNSGGKDDDNKRNFYESKFYLNKRIFKEGKFRVRSDLFIGAICYEREMDLSCKILEIDISSGAVLVESLLVRNGVKNCLWISPDDLVGNFRETARLEKGIEDVQSHESIGSIISCSALSRIGQSREGFAVPQQEVTGSNSQYTKKQYVSSQTVDLEMPPSWYSSVGKLSPSLRASDSLRSEFQVGPRDEYVRVLNTTDLTFSGLSSEQRIKSDIGVNSTFNNEISKHSSSTNSLNSTSGGKEIIDLTDEILEHADVSNTLLKEELPPSSSHSAFLPIPFELLDTNNRSDPFSRTFATSVGGPMLSSFAAASAITSNSAFPPVFPSATIELELNLLKRHGIALEFLMSATDLPTMVASLHYVKSMQQSNVPLGPTALEVVTEAEMTSRALMEDALLRQMTLSILSGGRGYNLRHAGMILCQMEPILGSKLGGLHTLSIDITKLLSLGLTTSEALDILPYIQKFENDILAKTLSIKRQLALLCS